MNYLFVSEDCIQCLLLLKILQEKPKEKWTSCLTLVYVKSSAEGKLETYIDEQLTGESPVSKVPAIYIAKRNELVMGGEEVFGELSNVNWFC
jgi:hypothetical protein